MLFKWVGAEGGRRPLWRSLGLYLLLAGWLAGSAYAMWVLAPTSPASLDVCRATGPR